MPDSKVENALSVFDQSNSLVKYSLGVTSLIMPDGVDFSTVAKMLNGFKVVGDATKFWRGDLLVYARRNFGEMFAQLVDESDFAYQSLKDEMWVSNSVDPSIRRGELSWSHHREVAALEKKEQVKYLELSVAEGLTSLALRALIRGKSKEQGVPRVDAYESALKAVLQIAMDSTFFNEKFYNERLEDSEKISPQELAVTKMAIVAGDALKVYDRKKE